MPNILPLVLTPPDSNLLYEGHYDPLLVVLSVSIAILASYVSFMVSNHIVQSGKIATRYLWTLVGGLCMGAGVWAMHFTGMLAFNLPCATTYDPVITLLSMVPGILASILAIWKISRSKISFASLLSGGVLMGAGIGAMHYTGMAAYRLNGIIKYDLQLFLFSLLIAVSLATLSLWIKFYLQSWQEKWRSLAPAAGAVVMGLAISAMHYTAMSAAYFIRDGETVSSANQLAPAFIASVVLAVTTAIIFVTLFAIFLSKPSVSSFSSIYRPIVALLLGWAVVSWIGADFYISHLYNQAYREGMEQTQQKLENAADAIREALLDQQSVPKLLAKDRSIRALLQRFGPGVRPSAAEPSVSKSIWLREAASLGVDSILAVAAKGFDADVVYVLNASGDCIASSNAGRPESFVGSNYSDRQYFQQPKSGKQGYQYAVGRISKIPGFFYSYPVLSQGAFTGVVVVKRDITNFLRHIKPANGYIVDEKGVIILAANRVDEFLTLPAASVMSLPEEEREQLYRRSQFGSLKVAAWKDGKFEHVVQLEHMAVPQILASRPVDESGISVYVAQPLSDLARIEGESPWVYLLVFITGSLFIITVSAVTLNIRATRKANEIDREAIARLREHEQQLLYIAHYDALTNLPNRVLLADRLQQAMAQSQRRNQSLAVVYIDLDGFKVVNDSYGHEMGDQLLVNLAQRMKAALRDGDSLARIGGDEFIAVLIDLDHPHDCDQVLVRLLQAAADPVVIDGARLQVSASAGVTFYPQDGADTDQLMRHADQAMYQAKQSGKNRYHMFDVDSDTAVKIQREKMEHIRRALDRHEFVLYYQPKVNMKSGKVIGAEALIRWQHPERGLLPPSEFLAIIENQEFSVDLGEWVIETALRQMTEWHKAGLELPVSVNIAGYQLQQRDFVSGLSEILQRYSDVPRHWLELEILETSALEDIAQVSEIMGACHAIGVHFALDDFGTGYSSLTYLKHLPAEMIKIDQSFVRDMLDDEDDLAIVKGVIGLTSAFHRKVIAEGVETIAHGKVLLELGCERAQGYGIARPMPAADIPAWVASWQPDQAWKAK